MHDTDFAALLSRLVPEPPIRWTTLAVYAVCAFCLLAAVTTPDANRPVQAAAAAPVLAAPRLVGWTATGGSADAELGASVARAGDVNGDGFDDLIVGAPGYSDALERRGRASLYLGSANGLQSAPAWTALGGTEFAYFGSAVGTAGDINQDGKSDFIVGEPSFSDGSNEVGRVHVFYGAASGISSTPAWTVTGDQDNGDFGAAVAGRFDLNGDGFGDVLVGAPYQEANGQSYAGCAHLYLGSLHGLATTAAWSACGTDSDQYYGHAVAAVGDVNGDLVGDIAVGSPSFTNGESGEGRVYVYHGSKSGLPGAPAWTAEGNEAHARFGYSVAGAGDVNKDGYADLLVGAYDYSGSHEYEGRAYLYRGSSAGLAAAPSWTTDGGSDYAAHGEVVASAWDVDDDGFSDVVVGGSSYSGDRPGEGRVLVYRGSVTGLSSSPDWTAYGTQIGAWFGVSVGAGYFDGDDLADIVVGAQVHSADYRSEGAAFAYMGGAGTGSEFVVDSSADDADSADAAHGNGACADAQGRCTFRAALQEANGNAGHDLITFARGMTVTVGALLGKMPIVTEPLTIDASSVWDDVGDRPGVVLDGAGGDFDGLHIMADAVSVFGLTVTGFGQKGVVVDGADNAIGGPGLGQRNVISGNSGAGVVLWDVESRHNIVQGNYIGVAPDGASALPNSTGVWISFGATHNLVGAETPDRQNVISGNSHEGVGIGGDDTDYNWVLSNVIGLAPDRSTVMGNFRGVLVSSGPHGTAVGWVSEMPLEEPASATARVQPRGYAMRPPWRRHQRPLPPFARSASFDEEPFYEANIIAGNTAEGVRVQAEGGFTGIESNTIRDNGAPGIVIDSRPNCRISLNNITRNQRAGVEVSGASASAVSLSANRIWDNHGKGISLLGGANDGIAPPTIGQANTAGAAGTACPGCLVEVFSDASDEGEHPEVYVEADASGAWLLVYPLTGPNITATSSDGFNGTSEFSAPFAIAPVPTATATTTQAATPTASATSTPTRTASATSTPTVAASPTPSATPSASATASPTAGPTDTVTPATTRSPEPSETPPASQTAATNEPTEIASATPSAPVWKTPTPGTEYSLFAPLLLKNAGR